MQPGLFVHKWGRALHGPAITGGVIDYTFPTSGTYAVQLTATDDANNEQAVDDFTV